MNGEPVEPIIASAVWSEPGGKLGSSVPAARSAPVQANSPSPAAYAKLPVSASTTSPSADAIVVTSLVSTVAPTPVAKQACISMRKPAPAG